jgi:CheY-like chemotaxis protein
VLIADDSSDSRDMYGEIVRPGGYEVLEAANGFEALDLAESRRPDVIVMDLCMPRMDGWEAIHRLKSNPRTRSIPVVALTALGWCLDSAGVECDAYLVKPCLPVDLLGVLDALVAELQ